MEIDFVSLIIASIALLGVIIVSIYTSNTDKKIQNDTHNKLVNIVKQVNTTQKANYNLDIKQQIQLEDMKKEVVTNKITFRGSNNYTIGPHGNNLNFGAGSNVIMHLDTSNNLNIDKIKSRGNNLSIVTSEGSNESMRIESSNVLVDTIKGINNKLILTADGKVSMSMDSSNLNLPSNINIGNKYKLQDENNQLKVTGDVKIDKLQLGDKFRLSGVGDKHANDGWLRMFDKDGNDYHGGIAMANLWVRDNSHLNGTTNANHLNLNTLQRRDGDWLRIHGTPANGVALYNSLSVNDNGGINVGAWGRTPTGQVHANHYYSRGGIHADGRIHTNEHVCAGGCQSIMHNNGHIHANHYHSRGRMHADDAISTNSALITGHPHIGGWTGANFRRRDGQWTHFDFVQDGRNYIRGNTTIDGHIHVNNNMSINRHIDAHEPWWHNKKALFAGWGSDQVVLGNHKTNGHDFARDLPANTVVSLNDLYVHGKTVAKDAQCVNNTCTNEEELKRFKASLPGSSVCVNNTCLTENDIKKLKDIATKPTSEICINNTCINEENLKQIKIATSPLTSSSLLSQKVLGENTTTTVK